MVPPISGSMNLRRTKPMALPRSRPLRPPSRIRMGTSLRRNSARTASEPRARPVARFMAASPHSGNPGSEVGEAANVNKPQTRMKPIRMTVRPMILRCAAAAPKSPAPEVRSSRVETACPDESTRPRKAWIDFSSALADRSGTPRNHPKLFGLFQVDSQRAGARAWDLTVAGSFPGLLNDWPGSLESGANQWRSEMSRT